ncbi:MAG: molybdopterin-binding protein, partial [Bacteroidota bacterium]
EYTGVEFEIEGLTILIKMTVKTIYKTGVEVEAMHGASVVALTLYDMLKPVDKQVEIESIKLLEKKGGKTSYPTYTEGLSAQVVVCSDRVSRDENEDKTGKLIVSKMEGYGLTTAYEIIPDEPSEITRFLNASTSDLLLFTGGVGVASKDRTPDTIRPLLDTTLPGVEVEMRRYGQERMHDAMLSRSVAGIKNGSVVLAFSGSIQGVTDGLSAVFPHLFHIFPVLKGERHD